MAPYRHLGTERNNAAREMGVDGNHPMQAAHGFVVLLVEGKRPMGHLMFMDREQARQSATAWLKGRGANAKCFLGKAIGRIRGRMLFEFTDGVQRQNLGKLLSENMEVFKRGGSGTPLDPVEFDRQVDLLSSRLNGIAKTHDTQAMKNVLNDLAKTKNIDALEKAAKQSISTHFNQVPNKLVDPQSLELQRAGRKISSGTRQGVNEKFKLGVGTSLSQFDERIGNHLVGSHANFVRDEYGNRSASLSRQAKSIVNLGQKQGLGIGEIQDNLAKKLGTSNVLRSASYWGTVSNAFVNRSRTFTAFNTYREAGVTLYQVSAVLDEATTDTCRFMHGKVLDLDRALANFEQQAALDNPLDLKTVNPWFREMSGPKGSKFLALNPPSGPGGKRVLKPIARVDRSGIGTKGTGKFSSGQSNANLMTSGVHGPPYHGRCRTDIIPVVRTISAPRSPRARIATPAPARVQVGESALESLKRREKDVKGFGGASLMVDESDIEGMNVRFREVTQTSTTGKGVKNFVATFKLTEHAAKRLSQTAKTQFGAKPTTFKIKGGLFSGDGITKLPEQSRFVMDALQFKIDGADFTHILQDALTVGSGAKEVGAWRNMVKVTLKGKTLEQAFGNYKKAMSSWGIRNPGGFPTAQALESAKKAAIISRFSPQKISQLRSKLNAAKLGQEGQAIESIWETIATKEMKEILDDAELREVFPGYSTFFSKKLSKKISKDVPLFQHSMKSERDLDFVLNSVRGKGGLKSAVYRFDQGSTITGQSTFDDFETGGADATFMRAWDGRKQIFPGGKPLVYVKGEVAGRLDWWGFNEDKYGRAGEALLFDRLSVGDLASRAREQRLDPGNELMFRSGIEVSDMERIVMLNAESRANTLERLKKIGIKEVNGLKLEDFIMDADANKKFLKSKATGPLEK